MAKKLDDSKWSDIVGMPDSWDKKNIQALVDTFSKTTFTIPGDDGEPSITITGAEWIRQGLIEARERHQTEGTLKGNDFGVKSKDMDMRVMCTVPKPLQMKLIQGYPSLFKDKKHLLWFARNFKMFTIPKRI